MNNVMHAIHQLCESYHIQLTATYLPGADNTVADHLSRLWPHHKWQLSPAMFCRLDQCWGPHTIDRTASASNYQLPHFNLRFSEAESEAVDCLLQDWSKDNNWTAPPIALIPCILDLVKRQHATATIIVPKWPGCRWFNYLKWLTVDPPASVPASARNFSCKSQSHPRAPTQQALEVDSQQDLWLPNPAGWSSAAANLLNNALAASTWKQYTGNLRQFKAYYITNNIPFPPEQDEAVGAVTSFLKSATRSSQHPCDNCALSVPIVGYKNDLYGDSKHVSLHKSSNKLCCPVQTFEAWKKCTRSLHNGVRNCPLLFSLQRPIKQLSASESAFILKELATNAGLDPAIFTAKTFRKSGVMAGIHAGVEPDAIFCLWRSAETFYCHYVVQAIRHTYTNLIFNVDKADTNHLCESTL